MTKEIFPAEAFAKSKYGALFVDMCEKGELEAEAYDIPNLPHIPLGKLDLRFNEIPVYQDVVVVYRGGGRSLHAIHFLISKSHTNAANMKQGILDWMREGLPVHKGSTLTQNMGFISINQL